MPYQTQKYAFYRSAIWNARRANRCHKLGHPGMRARAIFWLNKAAELRGEL